MESLQPVTVQLTKVNFDANKSQALINVVSGDAQAVQKFVSDLDSSEYLNQASITRKSRIKGSDAEQDYAIKIVL